jgi:uncharacterized repeat protein (TIGR03803 family)
MTRPNAWKHAKVAFLLYVATTIAAHGQTLTTLVNFDRTNGEAPLYGALMQGTDGSLSGTTVAGGTGLGCGNGAACGIAFKLTLGNELSTLHNFCVPQHCGDGAQPFGGLILATDGNLYGTTSSALSGGTVFKMTPGGKLTTIHAFNSADGATPYAGLIQAGDGNFYGTTSYGGANNLGTVFRVTQTGTLTSLHSFDLSDGEYPYAGLIEASDGNFYGTTTNGGANGYGTAFKLTQSGVFTTIHSFCAQLNCVDGGAPTAGLIQASDGKLYGATSYGDGTIFAMTLAGDLKIIHRFDGLDGSSPRAALIQATDGSLYGSTAGGGSDNFGTIFKVALSGNFTKLHDFDQEDGGGPVGSLLQDTSGTLYGTTSNGGTGGSGTVFSLSLGLGPFVAFVHRSGRVASTVGILGQGLTGTTSVSFNGTAATFTVVSDTFTRATVPLGAITGYVTVATPSGVLTSNLAFRVIP